MTDIISRLLDEAEKAQRKGHLVLAEVCRDASDKIGLLANELADMTSDYLRRHKDACDRMAEMERLRAEVHKLSTTCGHCGDLERAWAEAERLREALRRALHLHDIERAERPTPNVPAWVEEARALLTEGGR